jgi:endo-beta-N-acetylglucosaminidase D
MKKKQKRKFLLWIMALFALYQVNAFSQTQSYVDWSGQDTDSLLLLFRNGVPDDLSKLRDLEFRRSHVRPRAVIVNKAEQLDTLINPRRSMFFNCPIGSTKTTGLPSGLFDDDVFSMWQYVKIHGNWSNSWFTAPAAYSDAAHKHGTAVLSSWFFPWAHQYKMGKTKEEDPFSYMIDLLTEVDKNGNFIYAEPLINILMYFGVDGLNYNYEANSNSATGALQLFHQKLYEIAKQKGFNTFHIGWYEFVNNEGKLQTFNALAPGNYTWFYNQENKQFVNDVFMLNYGWGKTQLEKTESTANTIDAPNGALDTYAGCWIVKLNQAWKSLYEVPEVSLCFWGEHSMNRIFDHRSGLSELELQKNYQDRLDWVFTGGNKNPNPSTRLPITALVDDIANNTKLQTFHGIARYITERSTVQGNLPFASNFILGNGTFYHEKGIKTHGSWYNLSAQDICPTYRWLILNASGHTATNIAASFSFDDAWYGGNCLALSGTVKTTPTDIHLYRSDLASGTNAKARLVYKINNGKAGEASNLHLILKKNNDDAWIEYSLGNIIKTGWNEVELPLELTSPDKIKAIGLRVKGDDKSNYKALIGELKLYNSDENKPNGILNPVRVNVPKDLNVEYLNECKTRMDIKMVWSMSDENKKRLVYNDEVNVAYFEIFKKENEGNPQQIARTSSWAHYLANVELTPGLANVEIGVRAVSTDLTTVSDITWKTIARDPSAKECNNDIYCEAKNNMDLADASTAVSERFFDWLKTEGAITNPDIKGEATTDGYVGYLDNSQMITVNPGDSFILKAEGAKRQNGLQWCKYFVYADWNRNCVFDVDAEILARGGKDSAGDESVLSLNIPVTVPTNAVPGMTRIRIRYGDAWRAHPGACGLATHGYTVDLSVKILGDVPDGINDIQTQAPVFYPNPVVDNVTFKNVEKVSIYTVNGVLTGVYTNPSVNLSHLTQGIYIVKMEREGVTKSDYLIKR